MVGMVWSASATAQMTGFVVEVDTVFYGADTPTPDDTFDPEGVLDGYASFIVYAEFTNPPTCCLPCLRTFLLDCLTSRSK